MKIDLKELYEHMKAFFGHRNWWPGDTTLEIIIGAILTQNTAWKNVEKALDRLKQEKVLSYKGLRQLPLEKLAEYVRPSGYYNQKAKKIKAFIRFLTEEYQGNMKRMFQDDTGILREKLLAINGIGPETADSILLYAGGHYSFVIDLYTYRVMSRHGWIAENADYHTMRDFFMERLPRDLDLYKDFHAQFVAIGHHYCRKTPNCDDCPLNIYF